MLDRSAKPPALCPLLIAALAGLWAASAAAIPQEAPDSLADAPEASAPSDGPTEADGEEADASDGSGFDDLYNRVPAGDPDEAPPPFTEGPPSPEDPAASPPPDAPVVDDSGPTEGDPADTTPTIRTYRPSETPGPTAGLTPPREDPGLFGLYFPLTTYTELDARSADLQPWFFLGGLLPAGQAWLPLLVSKEVMPPGYLSDAALLMIVHALPHLVVFGTLPCGVLALGIPVVGPIIFVSAFLLNLVNVTAFLATNFYFMPVALLNAYDRAVRAPADTAEGHGRMPQATPMAY
jgi:hypothetical protein